ncbi:MAG: CDP-alcohol phosphatidyltransferase family protein [Rhodovarius sp.]|nr:CDP-alcohol phosphatidyltransferase family protein [Rhodovarius sp.]MCX7933181.1 CDP-alcohol phosphatidyltransferase family protein [Rhodovarius sp.]MDW8314403.1 CDP-alcohol phosphatidyltransferase family protein [Rhodovarius sp.]
MPADESAAGERLFTLPNAITLARLGAVPLTVWLMLNRQLDLAFLVFVGAGVSDALDGWIARAFRLRSALGALLDPVADKALLVSVYVMLAVIGVLPDWLAILVVFRDLVIVGGLLILWLQGIRPAIAPLWVSKLNTFAQITLAAASLFLAGFGLEAPALTWALIWIVAGTTIASGSAYMAGAAKLLRGAP